MTRDDEIAELRTQIRLLTDRAELGELVDRYALSLDERRFDPATAAGLFTDDVRFSYPVGDGRTLEGYEESNLALMAPYERTQHLTGNHVIDLDGDRARVRWNAIMTHVHARETTDQRGEQPGTHFDVGAHFTAEAVRTPGGWRFREVSLAVQWTQGTPPPWVADAA
ncbi:SnoaL-like protein [Saccharopolyspora erythraea NRRL 2338]|uniref:SnoaL-like domain-containing protein n=2 Tax=Saccharopolyspora erythraea TaxID=1836 RepID=A4FQP8_SACEN|nr:nuclear transport factor 2 family protein [Saccharopolyspora erythraea]EQD87729.1 hypothetical protein N599_02965 [Saccharopolyspora erythraea D]PFG92975.1 SnoaL-like protein [Saccharopolyspora erythraea NRRL 2338]QRK89867.1 nuclear transport factor 2 family protein [Saccharopolyspora erythraea]CAM06373.1 hypothetical protein SACE_7215 [Saccharopolyspora erythraea NRRL 2338]